MSSTLLGRIGCIYMTAFNMLTSWGLNAANKWQHYDNTELNLEVFRDAKAALILQLSILFFYFLKTSMI